MFRAHNGNDGNLRMTASVGTGISLEGPYKYPKLIQRDYTTLRASSSGGYEFPAV